MKKYVSCFFFFVFMSFLLIRPLVAQDIVSPEEISQVRELDDSEAGPVYGDHLSGLLGVNVSGPYGNLSVQHNDIALQANSLLDISVSRSFQEKNVKAEVSLYNHGNMSGNKPAVHYDGLRLFGDWFLEIPYMTGFNIDDLPIGPKWGGAEDGVSVLPSNVSINVNGSRHPVIAFNDPSEANGAVTASMHQKYQRPGGNQGAHIEGFGTPIAGRHTQSNWILEVGEGVNKWVAYSPDGTRYKFGKVADWRTGNDPLYSEIGPFSGIGMPYYEPGFPVVIRYLFSSPYNTVSMVTEVRDRFGNTVSYNYDDFGRVTSIVTSDGQSVVFEYEYAEVRAFPEYVSYPKMYRLGPYARIKKIHYNDKFVEYKYDSALEWVAHGSSSIEVLNYGRLEEVVYPDGTKWEIGHIDRGVNPQTLILKSPENLKGEFALKYSPVRDFLEDKEYYEWQLTSPGGPQYDGYGHAAGVNKHFNLVSSVISAEYTIGDGNTYSVDYDYHNQNPYSQHSDFAFVDETHQDFKIEKKYYITKGAFYGKLKHEKIYSNMNALKRTVEFKYQKEYENLVAPRLLIVHEIGTENRRNVGTDWGAMINRVFVKEYSVFENGTAYTLENLSFNGYGAVTKIKETGPSGTIYKKYNYEQDKEQWLINLPTTVEISKTDSNYTEISKIEYSEVAASNFLNASAAQKLPYQELSFGRWVRRLVDYHDDGNIERVEFNAPLNDGSGNRYVEYDNYKRGIPQSTTYPPRLIGQSSGPVDVSRVVNNDGWITAATDANGSTTHYNYNEKGALLSVDLADDPVHGNWLDTLYTWDRTPAFGIKRTSVRCRLNSARTACLNNTDVLKTTETFNGLMQVTQTITDDLGNNSSSGIVYQRFNYDVFGNPSFQSFASDHASEVDGTTFTYDALQRLESVTTTGLGATEHEYLSNNRIRVTDAEGNQETTTYRAYGAPSYKQAIKIESPENVVTDINIDHLGLVDHITQSGPGKQAGSTVSQTENYYYNQYKQLCLATRNDVGSTAYRKNAIGEDQWMAQGVNASITSCLSSQPSNAVSYSYDNLGQLASISYPDSSPDIDYYRDNNGNVILLTAGTIGHVYTYNNRNLLEDENFVIENDLGFFLDYSYNGLGSRTSLTYPDNSEVTFSPNNFGQPTQAVRQASGGHTAFTYASSAAYYPHGALDTFTYGNGLTHKTSLNQSLLPGNIRDSSGNLTALDYSYLYDDNLNITRLTDHVGSAYSLTNLQYDGLNRLVGTTGNSGIGSSSIEYDGLGNITYYQSKNSTLDYTYNTSLNRLASVSGTGAAGKNYSSFQYDNRGNVTNNSHRSFEFNLANQLDNSNTNTYLYDGFNRRVRTTDSKGTSYSFYNQEGTLVYRQTPNGGINYIYLGKKLIAKDGVIAENSGKQHYRPFGSSIEGEVDDVGYTGHKFDADLGLSYMQARYYDPVIGRFYSNDPIGFRDVYSFNRYAYANNNPYKYVDPDGMQNIEGEWWAWAAGYKSLHHANQQFPEDFKRGGVVTLRQLEDNGNTAAEGFGEAAIGVAVLSGGAGLPESAMLAEVSAVLTIVSSTAGVLADVIEGGSPDKESMAGYFGVAGGKKIEKLIHHRTGSDDLAVIGEITSKNQIKNIVKYTDINLNPTMVERFNRMRETHNPDKLRKALGGGVFLD